MVPLSLVIATQGLTHPSGKLIGSKVGTPSMMPLIEQPCMTRYLSDLDSIYKDDYTNYSNTWLKLHYARECA